MKYINMLKTAVLMAAFLVLVVGNVSKDRTPTPLEAGSYFVEANDTEVFFPTPQEIEVVIEREESVEKTADKQTFSKQKFASDSKFQLSIPKLSIEAPVLAMGLEDDGKMAVPNNYTDVGWYSLGSKPGEIGNAVLGAHVDDGASVSGVFKNLKDLSVGDDIYLTDKYGEVLRYRVSVRNIYDYRMQDTSTVFQGSGKSRLKLITCHGQFMPSENTYDKRLVITAELV